jgi:hypothetical protein
VTNTLAYYGGAGLVVTCDMTSKGRLLLLPSDVTLGQMLQKATNTLAFHGGAYLSVTCDMTPSLGYAPILSRSYYTWVEVTESNKHNSLLWCSIPECNL